MARRTVNHLGRTSQSPTPLQIPIPYAVTSITAEAAGRQLSGSNTSKYAAIMQLQHHLFAPIIATETFGPICAEGQSFIRDIGERISPTTSDPREAIFCFTADISIAAEIQHAFVLPIPTDRSCSDASHNLWSCMVTPIDAF
jgi:hypothetical protein